MATTTVSAGATSVSHDAMANAIRFLALDAVEKAKSGHPGLPMGCADIATVLWRDVLKFDASDPHWPDRDRFVLSGGNINIFGTYLRPSVAFTSFFGNINRLPKDRQKITGNTSAGQHKPVDRIVIQNLRY